MSDLAFVTGCSRGLGLALVGALCRKGFAVHGFARTAPASALKGCTFHRADLSATELPKLLTPILKAREGKGRTILINNAGTIHPTAPLGALDQAGLRRLYNLNLVAPVLLLNELSAALDADERGRATVVNISSGAGKHPYRSWLPYCSSKAALDMVTSAAALEQGEAGMKVISFSPGVIDTSMQTTIRSMDEATFPHIERFKELKAGGNLADPDTVAKKLVELLLEDPPTQGSILDYREL